MKLLSTIPAFPVADISSSTEFYRDRLGFTPGYREEGFAIVCRDAAELHLWAATDESWRTRTNQPPVVSGAESFIAGTASCRMGVENIDELYSAVLPLGIVHPNGQLADKWYGLREFAVLDPDNNLITFFEPVRRQACNNAYRHRI